MSYNVPNFVVRIVRIRAINFKIKKSRPNRPSKQREVTQYELLSFTSYFTGKREPEDRTHSVLIGQALVETSIGIRLRVAMMKESVYIGINTTWNKIFHACEQFSSLISSLSNSHALL